MIARTVRGAALAAAAIVGSVLCVSPIAAQPPGGPPPRGAQRPALEQLARVVQRRLALTDQQSLRLRETTSRFAAQRQQLMLQERETRRALRLATAAGDSAADQRRIAQQLDTLLRLQQRRIQLLSEEQRELGGFLTPYQRAQFLAMQERAFRAAQQLRQQRAAAGRQPPAP